MGSGDTVEPSQPAGSGAMGAASALGTSGRAPVVTASAEEVRTGTLGPANLAKLVDFFNEEGYAVLVRPPRSTRPCPRRHPRRLCWPSIGLDGA